MPTGYTAEIEKGISFENFVLKCARAMGACVMQRDESSDVLPKIQEPSDYYQKRITEIQLEIKETIDLELDDINKIMSKKKEDVISENKKRQLQHNKMMGKLLKMRLLVARWEAPKGDYMGLKDFMLEQISSTIDFDGTLYQSKFEESTPLVWKENKLLGLYEDLKRSKSEYEKEVSRTNDRNKWIQDLYDNLNVKVKEMV